MGEHARPERHDACSGAVPHPPIVDPLPRYPSPVAPTDEKLWRYASLARLWSWSLIVVAGLLLLLSIAIQAGDDEGLSARWFATLLGVTGVTGALLFPLFRVWLRRAALPSVRLPQAVRATGPRRLEASPRDWRRWAVVSGAILLVGGAAMLVFLIGVLGTGGTAEGVVVGMHRRVGRRDAGGRPPDQGDRGGRGAALLRGVPAPHRGRPQAGLGRGPGRGPAGVSQLFRCRSEKSRSGFSAYSSVRPQRTHVSERIALTRPDARNERWRLSETIPETTVGSTGPPHALHSLTMV